MTMNPDIAQAAATSHFDGGPVRCLPRRGPPAIITVTLAVGWCLAMSFSRLYLGVHFASDVIAVSLPKRK